MTEEHETELSNEEALLLVKPLDEMINWRDGKYQQVLDDDQLMQLVHELAADRGTRIKVDRLAMLAVETTAKRNLLTALDGYGFHLIHEDNIADEKPVAKADTRSSYAPILKG